MVILRVCTVLLARGLLSLLAFFAILPAYADTGAAWDHLGSPLFSHIGHGQGLPQSTISAIKQDRDGFIWIGTEAGLARWDGYTARLFRHEDTDPASLPETVIKDLLVDQASNLWVLTPDATVTLYQQQSETFQRFLPTNVKIGEPVGFVSDGNGGILVDGKDGLADLDSVTGRWTAWDSKAIGLPIRFNRGLAHGRDGSFWLARGTKLGRRKDGSFSLMTLPTDQTGGPDTPWLVSTIFENADGAIWYGTYGGQVGRVDPATGEVRLVAKAAVPGHPVFSIAATPEGALAFGFADGGVSVYWPDTGEAKRLTHLSGLAEDDVRAVAADNSGLLFIGTGRGVDLYSPTGRTITTLLPQEGGVNVLSGGDVSGVLPRQDGSVWFAIKDRTVDIVRPEAGRVASFSLPTDGQAIDTPDRVYSLAAAAGGGVLATTTRGIVGIDDGGAVSRFLSNDARSGLTLLDTASGNWVATENDGVIKIDETGRRIAAYAHDPANPNSLSAMTTTALADAGDGQLWVGTPEGLDLLDTTSGGTRHFRHDDRNAASLPAGGIWSVAVDRRGRIWAGTGGGGIGVLDAKPADGAARFTRIGRAQGMPDDNIDALVEDDAGRIWAATDDGLALIDPNTLAVIKVLQPADGQVITNYWENAGAKLPDGTLVFGGQGGVSIVHPDRVTRWDYRPPVHVSEVKIGGRQQPAAAPIVLRPNQRRLEVEFTALDYSAPELNRYEYRLDGYDSEWIAASAARRAAIYENLPPGQYRLLLRGSNREGLWTDTPVTLPITVVPAWYQTLGFELAEALALVLAVYGVVQWRTRVLERGRMRLESEVATRTEELAQSAETLRRANVELHRLAHHDPLTGLGNRRRFFQTVDDLLAHARRYDRPCSVMMIDLDHFKRINDKFGHGGGDETLREAARCLLDNLRNADVAARFGGEELAAFMPETDLVGAFSVAERFRRSLEAMQIIYEGKTIRVRASVGVAAWINSEETIDAALERADTALYRVKNNGRNGVATEPAVPSILTVAERTP